MRAPRGKRTAGGSSKTRHSRASPAERRSRGTPDVTAKGVIARTLLKGYHWRPPCPVYIMGDEDQDPTFIASVRTSA